MSFPSMHAHKIWEGLWNVMVPGELIRSPEHIKLFGTRVSGDKTIDAARRTAMSSVKISIIQILEYYEAGIEVQILERKDMIAIHKDIEDYLTEWRNHMTYSINQSVHGNEQLLLGLEKLSKDIYNKAAPREVIDTLAEPSKFGLVNPFRQAEEMSKPVEKPDYDSIGQLVRKSTKPKSRFG